MLIPFLARVLVAGIFVGAGVSKVQDRRSSLGFMRSKGMPGSGWLLNGAIVMELGVAPLFALGAPPRFAASALAAFLVPTTLVFHDFWRAEGEERQGQSIHFLKNLAIIGGLAGYALRDLQVARAAHQLREGSRLTGARPGYIDSFAAA